MLKLFFSFKGRIGRLSFFVGTIIVMVASTVIGGIAGGIFGASKATAYSSEMTALQMEAAMADVATGAGLVGGIVGLLSLWPSLALTVKRLHDLGRSGWMIVYMMMTSFLVPLAATISAAALSPAIGVLGMAAFVIMMLAWSAYLLFFKGTDGRNDYGMPPTGFTGSGSADYDQVFA